MCHVLNITVLNDLNDILYKALICRTLKTAPGWCYSGRLDTCVSRVNLGRHPFRQVHDPPSCSLTKTVIKGLPL